MHGCCETPPDLATPDRMGDRGACVAGLGGQNSGQVTGCGGASTGRGAGSVGVRRDGWGSAEATEMVLNNLFYITAKVRLYLYLSIFLILSESRFGTSNINL